jgi:hypothetical protein
VFEVLIVASVVDVVVQVDESWRGRPRERNNTIDQRPIAVNRDELSSDE